LCFFFFEKSSPKKQRKSVVRVSRWENKLPFLFEAEESKKGEREGIRTRKKERRQERPTDLRGEGSEASVFRWVGGNDRR